MIPDNLNYKDNPNECTSDGESLWEQLEDLEKRYGKSFHNPNPEPPDICPSHTD